MATIQELLKQKLAETKMKPTAAAKEAGLAPQSFSAVLKGNSVPNARSHGKYASFLGISENDVNEAIQSAKADGGTKRRPGRPKGSVAKKAGGKPGRKPGRPAAAKVSGDAMSALATISAALKESQAIAADPLAVKVHQLPKKQRDILEKLIHSL